MKSHPDTIDEFLMDDDKINLSISHGKNFRKGPLITALLFFGIGLLILYNVNTSYITSDRSSAYYLFQLIGIAFTLAGAFIFFSTTGVDIDIRKKKIRNYVKFIFKSGLWVSFERYPFITIIKLNKFTRYGGGFGGNFRFYGTTGPSVVEENDEIEICLLNKTHHKRITLAVTKDFDNASIKAHSLAKKLEVEFTEFKPVRISERKKMKR